MGNFQAARPRLEAAGRCRLPESQTLTPQDPGVAALVLLAPLLRITGNPTAALDALTGGLRRAEELAFPIGPFTRAYAHTYAAWFSQLSSDPKGAKEHAEVAIAISKEYGYATWLAAGTFHQAIASSWLDSPAAAVPQIEACVAGWQGAGANLFLPYLLLSLGDARRRAGDVVGARRAVEEGLAHTTGRDERFMEAELLRLRGVLAFELDPAHPEAAEADLLGAIQVARRQGARTFELRAAASLHSLKRSPESGEMLSRVLASFTDTSSMRELDDARALWEGAA